MKKIYFLGMLLCSIMAAEITFAQVTYNVDQSGIFNPIDISGEGNTQVGLSDDQVSLSLPIGFPFSFYGSSYTEFYISSNGFITFSPGQSQGCCIGGAIPSQSGGVDNLISVAWTDLLPGFEGGVIRYQTVGTAPDRTLVVDYFQVRHYSSTFLGVTSIITAQIQLHEGSNRIELHTTSLPQIPSGNGYVYTQGIENANGTEAAFVSGRVATDYSLTNDFVSFTPVASEVYVLPSQCGTTIPSTTSAVYANLVPGAERYRFSVTNLTTNTEVVKEYALRNVFIGSLSNFQYDQTYSIKVAVRKLGVWGGYGTSCTVSTPNGLTQLRAADCNGFFDREEYVIADNVRYALGYRFYVNNLTTGSVEIIDRPYRTLDLSLITDYNASGAFRGVTGPNRYFILVAALNTDGNYLDYGNGCVIEIGTEVIAPLAREIEQSSEAFKAVAYPNPFNYGFTIELNSASTSAITVVVYDMLGKKLEHKEVSTSEINSVSIGSNLTSGVYNVIVSQDGNSESLRMIKR